MYLSTLVKIADVIGWRYRRQRARRVRKIRLFYFLYYAYDDQEQKSKTH